MKSQRSRNRRWLAESVSSKTSLACKRRIAGAARAVPPAQIERLEERLVLSATPLITEFLAYNLTGLTDADGDHSDWIEIFNPSPDTLNLAGYYLTDNPGDLHKWQFPAATPLTQVQGEGYRLVFASGKDKTTATELHTNFNLSLEGEYLALVAPDATTVLSEYDYPPQEADHSYGLKVTGDSSTFIGPTAAVKVKVPTGDIGTDWRGLNYDDTLAAAGWTAGTSGVGYDIDYTPSTTPGFMVTMVDTLQPGGTDGSISDIGEAQSILNGTAGTAFNVVYNQSKNYTNINFGLSQGNFTGDNLLPNGLGTLTDSSQPGREQYALRSTATVVIPVGTYTINVNSDDGFLLRLPGVSFTSRTNQNFTGSPWSLATEPSDALVYGGTRGAGNTYGTFTVSGAPLTTNLTLDYFTGAGSDNLDLSLLNASSAFNAATFQLMANGVFGWQITSVTAAPVDFSPYISTNIQGAMQNKNASAYIRVPFTCSDPDSIDYLILTARYDDGFVAYLNGVEIARRNAPTSLLWNSSAPAAHNDTLAVTGEVLMITVPADPGDPQSSLLKEGLNILAIQVLNAGVSDKDLLMQPQLSGVHLVSSTEQYFTTPTPGALNNDSNMSRVNDTNFSVDRGFYTSPFSVTISTSTTGATIRYTTDGSAPTATSGNVYTGPIWVNQTTVLRAAAFRTNWISTNIDTETYIFPADVVTQSMAATPYGSLPASWGSNTVDYGMDQRIAVSEPSFVVYNGKYIFAASTATNGIELWISDGTTAGTTLLRDIWPGPNGSGPSDFVLFNSKVYFRANDGGSGAELWVTDGTTGGTSRVGDLNTASGSSYPTSLTVVGGKLFFSAYGSSSGTYGYELYAYDGVTFSTTPVRDIVSGSGGSYVSNLTAATIGGVPTLFFTATDGVNGYELWRSDGTTAGTYLVRDIRSGTVGSFPMGLTAVGSLLYFSATDGINGVELWRSDGTAGGTYMVRDIATGGVGSTPNSSYPNHLTNVNGTLFFAASESTNGLELWKSDGTTGGTVLIRNIAAGPTGSDPGNFLAIGNTLYFTATDGINGNELWKSDGTLAGTVLVKDIAANAASSSPANLTAVGSTLYFTATNAAAGTELWQSNGTSAGTVMVKDIAAGTAGSNPQYLAASGTASLFFTATVGTTTAIWKSDGTTAGTLQVAASSVATPSTLQTSDLLSIPTFSLVMNSADLFGSSGIYANPGSDGRAWERLASLELINPDGSDGFQIDAGVRIRGGYSRDTNNPKHGLRFLFRSAYGASKLDYPLFGPDTVQEFDGFDLRTFENYSWSYGGDSRGVFLRDQVTRDLQLNMGDLGSHGNYYFLYINGMFFGIYDTDERPEADFAASYLGGNADDYDVVKVDTKANYTIYATDGDMAAWTDLYNQLIDPNISTLANYMKVQGKNPDGSVNPNYANLLDVDDLIDYVLEAYWEGNLDAPLSNFLSNYRPNNEYAVRNRLGISGGFKFIQHDGEHTLFKWSSDGQSGSDDRTGPWQQITPLTIPAGGMTASGTTITVYTGISNTFSTGDWVWIQGANQPEYNGKFQILSTSGGTTFTFSVPVAPTVTTATGSITMTQRIALNRSNAQSFFEMLETNAEFRLRVADRINKHMLQADGALSAAAVTAAVTKRAGQLSRPVVAESARWGDSKLTYPLTRNIQWQNEINRITVDETSTSTLGDSWISDRGPWVFNQLKADNLYPTYAGSVINAPAFSRLSGTIPIGTSITISSSVGVIYYTLDGTDPRLIGGTGGIRGNGSSAASLIYTSALTINKTTPVKARVLYNGIWSALTEVLYTANLASLRVSEVMYAPPDAAGVPGAAFATEEYEYIELVNTSGTLTLDLSGVRFTAGVTATLAAGTTLAPGARGVVVKNIAAFQERYGTSIRILGSYTGTSLNNGGEEVTLSAPSPSTAVIEDFTYGGNWYALPNGGGYSLVARDPSAADATLSTKDGWRPSNILYGGPGAADAGINPNSVVINEAVTHSDLPIGDWIELKNTTASAINISGWFLSDAAGDLTKYKIAAGTTIPANGSIVFTQANNFANPADTGVRVLFGLSELGDDVYLSNNDGTNNAGGYRETAHFAAADKQVPLGLYTKSTGGTDFVAMQQATYNSTATAAPLIGPVVISELMYDPPNGSYEYIELRNITGSVVPLHDASTPANGWRVDGITSGTGTFSFPDTAQISAYGYVILTETTEAAFRAAYPAVPAGIPIYTYTGSLDNNGETITLSRPGQIVPPDSIPWIVVDSIKYDTNAPWPTGTDKTGRGIQKLSPGLYGNDPANWATGPISGTPGQQNTTEIPMVDAGSYTDAINQGATFTRNGSFGDGDTTQTWAATVNYGDGTGAQALALTPSKTFSLARSYANPGTYTVTVTVTDSTGASGTQSILLSVRPTTTRTLANTTIRRDPSSAYTQFFENVPTSGNPTFSIRTADLGSFAYATGSGNDTFTIDMTYGNPLPLAGATLDTGGGADTLVISGSPWADAISLSGQLITFDSLITLSCSNLESLTINAADGDDQITIGNSLPYVPAMNGGSGNDTLILDLSAGDVSPSSTFDGGGGTDKVIASGRPGLAASYTPSPSAFGNGTIGLGTSAVTLSSTESLAFSTVDSLTYAAPSANNSVSIAQDANPALIDISPISGGNAVAPFSLTSSIPLTINTPAGSDALSISGGSALVGLSNPATSITGTGGTLSLNMPVARPTSINLSGTARLNLMPGTGHFLRTGAIALAGSAILDARDNDIIVDYSGATPIDTVRQWLLSGDIGAAAPSILTSRTSVVPGHPATLAQVDNTLLHLASWNGETLTGSGNFHQIIIKYTYRGDTNLDGQVTPADYVNVLAAMGAAGQWFNGDLNHDGTISVSDLAEVSANLGAGVATDMLPSGSGPAPAQTPSAPAVARTVAKKKPVVHKKPVAHATRPKPRT